MQLLGPHRSAPETRDFSPNLPKYDPNTYGSFNTHSLRLHQSAPKFKKNYRKKSLKPYNKKYFPRLPSEGPKYFTGLSPSY